MKLMERFIGAGHVLSVLRRCNEEECWGMLRRWNIKMPPGRFRLPLNGKRVHHGGTARSEQVMIYASLDVCAHVRWLKVYRVWIPTHTGRNDRHTVRPPEQIHLGLSNCPRNHRQQVCVFVAGKWARGQTGPDCFSICFGIINNLFLAEASASGFPGAGAHLWRVVAD